MQAGVGWGRRVGAAGWLQRDRYRHLQMADSPSVLTILTSKGRWKGPRKGGILGGGIVTYIRIHTRIHTL